VEAWREKCSERPAPVYVQLMENMNRSFTAAILCVCFGNIHKNLVRIHNSDLTLQEKNHGIKLCKMHTNSLSHAQCCKTYYSSMKISWRRMARKYGLRPVSSLIVSRRSRQPQQIHFRCASDLYIIVLNIKQFSSYHLLLPILPAKQIAFVQHPVILLLFPGS
jgi:hypothetical protein